MARAFEDKSIILPLWCWYLQLIDVTRHVRNTKNAIRFVSQKEIIHTLNLTTLLTWLGMTLLMPMP